MDKVRANIADVKELLLTKDARKPMVLGVFMISMQQLSGIDGVIYVSLSARPSLPQCFEPTVIRNAQRNNIPK